MHYPEGSKSHVRRVAAALLVAAGIGAISASAAFAQEPTTRKIPGNFVYLSHVTGDRCLWGVGVEYPSVPKATSYTIKYYDGYYHRPETGGQNVPIAGTQGMTKGMNYFGITGGGGPAPCVADASQGGRFSKPPVVIANFPAKPRETGAIEGMVTNKDGNPVQGAKLTAYGPSRATAESGPGGLYYMEVDAGHYRVVPDDSSVKKSSFAPTNQDVSVSKGGDASADFKLDLSLQLTMDLSSTSVSANGYQIVTGTITTTNGGKPEPGVNVKLSVDPTDPHAALTSAPKVAICGPTGRVWPTGPITNLDGNDITITTDSTGTYKFSLTVGTVPGKWDLDAWAYNDDGQLSTDAGDASETKSLNVTPVTPNTDLGDFPRDLKALQSTNLVSQLTADPGGLTALLSSLPNGSQIGGLTFSVGQGTDGSNMIIAPATAPFVIGSSGQIERSSSLLNDLIIDPQEWTGAGLPSTFVNASSLQTVLQRGPLLNIPTVNGWESGSSVTGWKLTPNKLTDPNSGLVDFGWAYQPSTSVPGYCS
jgi:Carboxypeptidase regulatory-like domain